jgi:hypothetical protein
LIGPTLASFVAAFIVVKIFDFALSGVSDSLASVMRAVLFIGTWTVVTARAGMSGFTSKVRRLRAGTASAIKAFSTEKP